MCKYVWYLDNKTSAIFGGELQYEVLVLTPHQLHYMGYVISSGK